MSKTKRITHKENMIPNGWESTYSIGWCDEYTFIKHASPKELRKKVNEICDKWLKLEPEVLRARLLYHIQDLKLEQTGEKISQEIRGKIHKRKRALEDNNSLGEYCPLGDRPRDASGKVIGRKRLRKLNKENKLRAKEQTKTQGKVTPEIEALLKEKETASPERAKKIRARLRSLNFFISKS